MSQVDPAQVALPNVPDTSLGTPDAYVTLDAAQGYLSTRWNLSPMLAEGHILVASMNLDQEGPFQGVKYDVTQERQWPRTFKYGWPNVIAAPTPVMATIQFPGAFYLDYEGVVPQQVVDWVCLEAYRITTLPWDRMTTQESVTGASVHYAPPVGEPGGMASMLEQVMQGLLMPFLLRTGHQTPFPTYQDL